MISVEYHKGNQPFLVLHLPENFENQPVEVTLISLASVFDQALKLADSKERTYGGAWRRQGWMGNLARIMSKTERLKNMLWSGRRYTMKQVDQLEESANDTAIDQINMCAFFLVNWSEGNEWGTR